MDLTYGKLKSFGGSWGSGLASLTFVDPDTQKESVVHADNGPLVRFLDGFGEGVIGDGHTVDPRKVARLPTFYWYLDDMGLTLGGLIPADELTEDKASRLKASDEGYKIIGGPYASGKPDPAEAQAKQLRKVVRTTRNRGK